MSEKKRWAILGTGNVANRFATALNNLPEQAELLAVGSRSQETAAAFAEKHNIPTGYASYENVAADPHVEIVYIGTPHPAHHRDVRMCLEAGKHVLNEKAFTMNADEAEDVINLARQKKLFLMEAMWTRFFPIQVRVREILAAGLLGELQGLVIHHAYTGIPELAESYPPELGMGAFMDQAPYGVALAYSLIGPPIRTTGFSTFGPRGMNYQNSYVFEHEGGKLTTWMASRTTYDIKEAVLYGTEGKIDLHEPWYKPTAMTIHVKGKKPERIELPLNGFNGYEYEAMAVMDCIRAGKTECDIMPLDETLAIMKTMDSMRAQWKF
jgi:dihydrodiol dehydrogenase / D-xylose 1-dehydrogenase (NADP)